MFDILYLFTTIIATLLVFRRYIWSRDLFSRFFFGLIVLFLYLYCGLGAALKDCHPFYLCYYLVYILFVYVGLRFSIGRYIQIKSDSVCRFIDHYGLWIIYLYVFLVCLGLVYPENRLLNLIHPPAPDLLDVFEQRFETKSVLSSFIVFIQNFLTPFFYISLYYYKNRLWKMGGLLIFLMYVSYCSTGYIGRGSIFVNLLFLLSLLYIWKPSIRKCLIISIGIFMPFLFLFFVNYSSIRIGGEAQQLSLGGVFETLLLSESSYPLLFDSIYGRSYDAQDAVDYIYWLLTLPFPVSLNFFDFDFSLNYKISELLLGVTRGEEHFFVLLPGIVGESYFVFKDFFWIHAFFYGTIVGWVYTCVKNRDVLFPIGIYSSLILGYYCARGGTAGAYPFILKQLLYAIIILKLYQYHPVKFVLRMKS